MKDIQLKHQRGKPIEISIKGQKIGRGHYTMISGPCTIENYEDLYAVAVELKKMGIHFFRGGAYKMRTSPYNFQGLGKKGLEYMKKVADETRMISVSEVVAVEDVDMIKEYVDILQVGTRNMSNYRLLFNLGKIKNPIILKLFSYLVIVAIVKKNTLYAIFKGTFYVLLLVIDENAIMSRYLFGDE